MYTVYMFWTSDLLLCTITTPHWTYEMCILKKNLPQQTINQSNSNKSINTTTLPTPFIAKPSQPTSPTIEFTSSLVTFFGKSHHQTPPNTWNPRYLHGPSPPDTSTLSASISPSDVAPPSAGLVSGWFRGVFLEDTGGGFKAWRWWTREI